MAFWLAWLGEWSSFFLLCPFGASCCAEEANKLRVTVNHGFLFLTCLDFLFIAFVLLTGCSGLALCPCARNKPEGNEREVLTIIISVDQVSVYSMAANRRRKQHYSLFVLF
ncbi:hypothetical protein B0H63DRAFT_163644 [Podospora didyma]|uniref:Secreted protein n=1 Tax=Podospora didyma TaxID=330526 RepID=A0AAE0NTY4_9PEZI|nr:hypothetical protein B0H63DRAFT_163644 [Podospora didyma]